MTDLTLTTSRTIAAPQQAVFEAWLNPDMLRQFMCPAPGMSVPAASNDPREGGRFDVIMKAGEDEMPHAGTYRKITKHSQIVFTWESPYSTDDSEVTLDFAPDGDGTKVTLTHVRFASEESRDNHLGGWNAILDALNAALLETAS